MTLLQVINFQSHSMNAKEIKCNSIQWLHQRQQNCIAWSSFGAREHNRALSWCLSCTQPGRMAVQPVHMETSKGHGAFLCLEAKVKLPQQHKETVKFNRSPSLPHSLKLYEINDIPTNQALWKYIIKSRSVISTQGFLAKHRIVVKIRLRFSII